jgi:hypothetical protein
VSRFRVVPVSFKQACEFVADHHRHHRPPRGHKFSLGAVVEDQLVGVAIVGRPVARRYDDGRSLEVTRCCVIDGQAGACGYLYAAARRATFALGYDRLLTYTQEGETGASLRAAGYRLIANRPARKGWNVPSRPREVRNANVQRFLWEAVA